MELGLTFMIVGVLIIAIWIIFELKRLKHKIFAIFLIAFILFLYVSFTYSIKGQEINIKNPDGIIRASKIYFAWIGSAFGNMKTITTDAIRMDWNYKNESAGN